MTKQTQLPFFNAGHDLPLFSDAHFAPLDAVCTCTEGAPPHIETRQCQYDKALALMNRHRASLALTQEGYDLDLAALNADYPECSRDADSPALCESCLERPATGELCGSPLCDPCAQQELATLHKLGLPVF